MVAGLEGRAVSGKLPRSRGDGRLKEIDVEVLQRAFRDSEMSQNQVARELNWCRKDREGIGDGVRFARAIGLTRYRQTLVGGNTLYRRIATVRYERAVMLVVAMGLEPADYGL